jgi:hypothetical protein
MRINTEIFKAYDVRGLYPGEINEEVARQIGRGFITYLGAKKIAVSRDMRVSSPGLAAAFIQGAREQGADVIDYGMLGTDMMYFGVINDELEGGAHRVQARWPQGSRGRPLRGDQGARRGVLDLEVQVARRGDAVGDEVPRADGEPGMRDRDPPDLRARGFQRADDGR